MNLSIFGLGYIGSVTAACLANKGHWVIGVEANPDKLALFQAGRSPLFEPGLAELLARVHAAGSFTATADVRAAIQNSDLSFICVGTPSRQNGQTDLAPVENVCRGIGAALRAKPTTHTVVVRSTLLPGHIENTVVQVLEAASGKREGRDFQVVANPEFMREGSAIGDFCEASFVVIGERTPGAGELVAELYRCVSAPQIRVSIPAAAAIKFACNAFHALKITFANEVGQFCRAHGIDSHEVMEIVTRDHKLNISPAYLQPGFAFGGSCLPKDLRALVSRARDLDLELPMLEAVARSNAQQIEQTVAAIAGLDHREIGFLGLSFKAGTDDLRESPTLIMAEALLTRGCHLAIHDSEVELTRLVGANRQFLETKLPHISGLLQPSLARVLAASRTIVVCKKHEDYRDLARRVTAQHRVLDLVGFLKGEQFPAGVYHGLYW